jgi:FkbM family methyltransferase
MNVTIRRIALVGVVVLAVVALVAIGRWPTARDPLLDDILEKGTSVYARDKEEPIIRDFFQDRRNGFYVDIGCYDYKEFSTTYYLEERLGWTGIGVDALTQFEAGWKKHRPRSKFYAYAVTDKSGETITFYQAGGISSTEHQNIKKWQKLHEFQPKEIKVPTITIDDLLDRDRVKKIDFLSMDINGGEATALRGFDIDRFKPELVHVEVHPHHKDEIAAYFAQHGYERIEKYLQYDKTNWYYTPKKAN